MSESLVDVARPRVAVATLGCKVNLFESELIAKRMVGKDYARVPQGDVADIYIINSCTVTAEADRQTRQLARKFKRQNPAAQVVVTGCYAETQAETLAGQDAVDWVVGNAAKLQIPDLDIPVRVAGSVEKSVSTPAQIIRPGFEESMDADVGLARDLLNGFDSHSRAFFQIQQGCDRGCTFCIIHTARGPSRSFAPEAVVAQAKKLVAEGYRELVLCGVDLGAYGEDLLTESTDLAKLLMALLVENLDCRFRISSIDPAHLSDELIALMAEAENICPHIHLSLQSANTLILKRMKRRAHREQVYERVAALRAVRPDMVLSADVLVGFPTETVDQFADTLAAIDELEIAYPHVFPYSPREGTPAAKIPDQVENAEKKRRARLVREAGQKVWQRVAERQIGQVKKAIVEQPAKEGAAAGENSQKKARCDNYFPVVFMPSRAMDSPAEGDWVNLKMTGIKGDSLIGEMLA